MFTNLYISNRFNSDLFLVDLIQVKFYVTFCNNEQKGLESYSYKYMSQWYDNGNRLKILRLEENYY